LIVRAEKD